jgi:hypothetical protein
VNPGQRWKFRFRDAEYEVVLLELNYLNDTFRVRINEV